MKSLSISDRKKLSSLYERYGYDNILKFNNVLNESFSSNVLFELNRINSTMHIGIDGQDEKPLSPIGAAFMKAFPIPWDKVTDDMIEMYADNKMFPYLGIDDADKKQIRDKNYDGSLKTSSYVSDSGKLDSYRSEFMDLSKIVRRCIRKIENANTGISTKIGMSKDELNFIEGDNDANYTKRGFDEWIDSTSKLSDLYHYNKENRVYSNYIILTTIEKLLRFLIAGDVYRITKDSFESLKRLYWDIIFDNNKVDKDLNYLDTNIATTYNMDLLGKAYSMLSTLSHADDKNENYIFVCGIPGFLKTRTDVFDKYDSMNSVMYPTVADMIQGISDIQINNKSLMSFDDASAMVHEAGYVDNMAIRDFSNFYKTIESTIAYYKLMDYPETKSRKYRDRIKNVFHRVYDKIRVSKRASREYAGAKLISTIYNKMHIYGKSNSAELNSITEDIFSYYKDKDNSNGFRLYILTDKRLKILYVVSCIKADLENNNGYAITTGLYGWRYGDKPDNMQKLISDMSNNKHIRTKSGVELYKYSMVSEEDIKNDRNLACAFVISSKNKDYNVKDNTFRQINNNIIRTIRGAYNIDDKIDDKSASITLKGGKFDNGGDYLINMLRRNGIDYTIDGSVINLKVDDNNYGRIGTLLGNMKDGIVDLYDTLTRYASYENAFTDIDVDFDTLYNKMLEEFGCIDNGIINIGDYNEKYSGYDAIKNAIEKYNSAVYDGTSKGGIYYYYTTVAKRANSIDARRNLDNCRIRSCRDMLSYNTKKIIERINDLLGFSYNSAVHLNINMKSLGRDIIYSMQIKRKSRENLGRTVYANAVDYSPSEHDALLKADELENMKKTVVDDSIRIPKYKQYIGMIDRTIYEWPFGATFVDFKSRIDETFTKLYTNIKGKVGFKSDINRYYNIGCELYRDVCFMYKYVGATVNDTIKQYLAENSVDYDNYKIDMDKVTEKNLAKCNNTEIVAKIYSSMMQIYNKYNTILMR